MTKNLKIWEIGYIARGDEEVLVLRCELSHGPAVVDRRDWKAPLNMPTVEICRRLMDEYDATQFQYQTMWTLPVMDPKYFSRLRVVPVD